MDNHHSDGALMTRLVIVGTMLRGAVIPPEPLDEANQIAANVAERMIQRERDGPPTRREWAAEEGYRSGFVSSYGRKKMRG
jgi:hypothetical protein